jgi:hypothetical protein
MKSKFAQICSEISASRIFKGVGIGLLPVTLLIGVVVVTGQQRQRRHQTAVVVGPVEEIPVFEVVDETGSRSHMAEAQAAAERAIQRRREVGAARRPAPEQARRFDGRPEFGLRDPKFGIPKLERLNKDGYPDHFVKGSR